MAIKKSKPQIKRTVESAPVEKARSIWLAGLGAVSIAQKRSETLFAGLVAEGKDFQHRSKKFAHEIGADTQAQVKGIVEPLRMRAQVEVKEATIPAPRSRSSMPRLAVRTKRPWGRINRVVILLLATLGTAALVGIPTTIAGGVNGEAGTTVGAARYAVPARAIVVSRSGRDSAAGTRSAPLRTLTHAVAVAPAGATIVLRAGSYHESVVIPSTKRLTIQAWPGEAVWLDGSVPVTGWASSRGLWTKTGWKVKFDASPTYTRGAADNTGANWGFVDPSHPMAAHPDQVWINGAPQRQVRSKATVVPGTFYVDYAAGQLWLGSNPRGKAVRASDLVRALMIRSAGSVVRGVGVRRFAPSVPDMGAVTVENNGVLIENVAITDSATTGLHVGSGTTTSGVVIRNVPRLTQWDVGHQRVVRRPPHARPRGVREQQLGALQHLSGVGRREDRPDARHHRAQQRVQSQRRARPVGR